MDIHEVFYPVYGFEYLFNASSTALLSPSALIAMIFLFCIFRIKWPMLKSLSIHLFRLYRFINTCTTLSVFSLRLIPIRSANDLRLQMYYVHRLEQPVNILFDIRSSQIVWVFGNTSHVL